MSSRSVNPVMKVLQEVKNDGTGTFWCPPTAYQDMGYVLPGTVRPSESKAVESELRPKHKDEERGRHLFTGHIHKWK